MRNVAFGLICVLVTAGCQTRGPTRVLCDGTLELINVPVLVQPADSAPREQGRAQPPVDSGDGFAAEHADEL